MPADKDKKAAPPPSRVHFLILVTLEADSDGDLYPIPRNTPKFMNPGDTVTYKSPDGTVTIKFTRDSNREHSSPYAGANGKDLLTVNGGEKLTVRNSGKFLGKCTIMKTATTRTGKPKPKYYRWTKKTPQAGGNVVVKSR
jgi:hypothetical protein